MGQRRQSQSNDEKNSSRKRNGKQQRVGKDKASAPARSPQQRSQGADRSQQAFSDGAAPRAGSSRDADNPSLSANQEDHRGEQDARRGDSVESLQSDEPLQRGRGSEER